MGPDGDTIGSFATDANGEIQIPEAVPGNYTIYERVPPKDHLLSENDTQNVTVREGETATVTENVCHITLMDLHDASDFFALHSGDYAFGSIYSAAGHIR